ncbi:actin cortical patch SUR7/pH-response regulator pali [Mariannaea sp. PMI_226]|nr:actin cortical patch SUR7/pH-response regulator pali [Mariannaea sp. PMI_226]
MGVGRFIHHIGTFLLLVSTICLLVVTITAPVVHEISILRVSLDDSSRGSAVTFGTFGYCIIRSGDDDCSKVGIGYDPAKLLIGIDRSTYFSNADEDAVKALTKIMVLHPVACGLSFIAFLVCLGAGVVGSLIASLMSALTFLVTIVALACDFGLFALIRHKVNDNDVSTRAHWSAGIWLILVAAICNLIAAVLVFVSCCSGRRSRRRRDTKMNSYHE